MTTERDIRNQIAYSREEGREEGLAEGLEKGRAEGKAESRAEGKAEGKAEERRLIARKLKEKGFSDEEVASILD